MRPPLSRSGVAPSTARARAGADRGRGKFRVVPGLLVPDAVTVSHVAGEVAALEEALRGIASEAQHDQGLGGRLAVAARPIGVDPADRGGQSLAGPYRLIAPASTVIARPGWRSEHARRRAALHRSSPPSRPARASRSARRSCRAPRWSHATGRSPPARPAASARPQARHRLPALSR